MHNATDVEIAAMLREYVRDMKRGMKLVPRGCLDHIVITAKPRTKHEQSNLRFVKVLKADAVGTARIGRKNATSGWVISHPVEALAMSAKALRALEGAVIASRTVGGTKLRERVVSSLEDLRKNQGKQDFGRSLEGLTIRLHMGCKLSREQVIRLYEATARRISA